MSIPITRLSRPLAVGVVDVVAVGSVVVRTALVDERVAAAIAISGLSRPLAISIAAIAAIAVSSQTLGASVDRAGTTIGMVGNSTIAISRLGLSIPLAIVATMSITSISIATISLESLDSVVVAGGATIAVAIARLGLSVPLAVAIDVVAIVVVGGAVAIAMVSLRHMHGCGSVSTIAAIAITRLSLGLPLAVTITAIAVTLDSLGGSVVVAGGTTIAVAIARLGSSKAGKGENDRKRFNCHGVDTKLSQIAMYPH